METDISEISIGATNSHTQFNGLELGLRTLFKPSKVTNLKKLKYNKATRRIVQQQVKQIPVTGSNPISILTQTPMTRKVNEDPLSITSVGTTFSNAMKQSLKKLFSQNQD